MEPVTGVIGEVASGIGEATVQATAPAVEAGIGTIAAITPNVGTEAVGAVASPLGNMVEEVSIKSGGADAVDADVTGENLVKETGTLPLDSVSQNLEPNSVGADTNQAPTTTEEARDQIINDDVEKKSDWENLTRDQKIDRLLDQYNEIKTMGGDVKDVLKKLDRVEAQAKEEARKRQKENEELKKQNEESAERQKLLEAQQKQLLLILADIDNKNRLSATPSSGT